MPKVALRFSVFNQLSQLFPKKSFWSSFASGAGAGAVEAIVVVTPSEVVKIRQQELFSQKLSQWTIAKRIFSESDVKGFYRGALATSLRQSIQQGFKFRYAIA